MKKPTQQQIRPNPETVYDQRTALVREMLSKESAANDAKTARLRALRLAKQAGEAVSVPVLKGAPKAKSRKS